MSLAGQLPVEDHSWIATKGRTIRKVLGGGEIFSLHAIFFAHCLCRNFFFRLTPRHEFFFQTNIAFFLTVESWFIIYVFVLYKLSYTDKRSKFRQNLYGNVHTVREEEATRSGRLPCAFFQSLPSGIPLPQPIKMMPYSIHQNSSSVLPSSPKCQSKKKVPVQ